MSSYLSPLLVHAAPLHALHANSHPGLLDLALLLLLGVLKVSAMAELHQMARLVALALETAEGAFDRFTVPYVDLDGD